MPPARRGGPRIVSDDLTEFRRALDAVDKTLVRDVGKAMQASAQPVVAEAKTLAPRGTRPIPKDRVPRRRLADTITTRRRGLTVSIVARGPHAKTVHDGGRHPLFGDREHWIQQRPRPFIADAIDHQADQIAGAIGDAVQTSLDRALTERGIT